MSGTDAPLSNVECLLLAQAVYEYGSNAWQQVSKLLSKHPLLSRPKHFFSSNSCRDIYARLMNEAQLECSDENNAAHAPANLQLAQKFYTARLVELRDLIAAEEIKFKTIVAEIQEIRDGKSDAQIRAKLSGAEIEPESEHNDAVPPDAPRDSRGPEQEGNEPEPERQFTPQPEEVESEELEIIEPGSGLEPLPLEEEPCHPPQSEERESENDELKVQPIEVGESSTSIPEETEEHEEDQQPTSPDDEASEIEAILTPEPPEGSAEVEARELSVEHDEVLPDNEQEMPEQEEEVMPTAQHDTGTSQAEQGHETPMDVDAEERDVSVDAETSIPGKRKVSDSEGAGEPEKKRLREESSPATPEEEERVTRPRRGTTSSEQRPGPSTPAQSTPSASTSLTQPVPNKRFQAVITLLHSQISQHRNGNIFHNPIKPSEAPDYHEIIKRPMDLKTIKARIKDGVIRTSVDFQRDVCLMFANAMMYNRPGSGIALMAEEMMLESEVHINTFRQTEGYLRNTRT
ncbi:Bromodomain-domain-containing protein [Rhizopogon vinicolor AM-OR11-026]|uniref:Bromodomain-domain-containing protein n=1 Tax=Rhizopogon vinicolor AM-OR11-026 TaxID=1314800 RepID=A0A1B7NEW9_9AGAM|nr:Bromodomain-domain-containing protein [Rhizopogon vinicolor AM-OR11-026]